ncbi:HAAS signaling domain-containing protein [Fimbriiglobus ruber]|uniref:Uncharacterized protein n=1 Tax=Fimbriiglobus ruber TaxID=1908690 RepID=A0A225DZF1_9BACT|nr:hypothetical protein [Fimbriiglobus ruber]OWK41745.1 hypothetical protein FRUB_03823 [Fimbriiglobus ruber]
MDRRPWSERVEAELVRRGVPARFRARFVAELRDHIDDLKDEESDMTEETIEGRFGAPDRVAAAAAEEYRRAGWVRRHPVLTFALAPLPVTLLGLVLAAVVLSLVTLCVLVAAAALTTGGFDPKTLPRWVKVDAVYFCHHGIRLLPFALAPLFFGRLVVKYRTNAWWLVLAIAQIAVMAALYKSHIVYSDEPGQSQWMIGLSLPPWEPTTHPALRTFFLPMGWGQFGQLVLPFAVGGLFAWAAVRRRRAALA